MRESRSLFIKQANCKTCGPNLRFRLVLFTLTIVWIVGLKSDADEIVASAVILPPTLPLHSSPNVQ